jgi:hypothetical protein
MNLQKKVVGTLLLGAIITMLIWGCSGDDTVDILDANTNPGNFVVTVSEVTETSASLSWTPSIDVDGDVVTYAVEINGASLTTGETGTRVAILDLSSETQYTGNVIATDGQGGSTSASFNFTTDSEEVGYTLDPTLFTSTSFTVEAKLVDCVLENGSSTQCYELTFISNPVNDDGPFCPATLDDIGGMGIYDGTTNPGFQVMKRSLFESMENDGYDIVAMAGNIRVSDFSGGDNPDFAYCLHPLADDNLELTFTIPAIPELLSNVNSIETVELIGVSIDGVPMNGAPPSVTTGNMGNGNIPSLDPCGGHADPSGYYHWHFVSESITEILVANGLSEDISCTNMTQDNTALSGFAKDGFPIYASADMNGNVPTDLDECQGHIAATNEYPDGVYHYHASTTEAPNMPPCIKGAAVNNPFTVN